MAIREKLRKRFGSKKNGSGDSVPDSNDPPRRKDIEYYKPHEIPKSKYRGKVDKAHQEKLESYSLGDAFNAAGRRASQAISGSFSPGGTQSHSRRSSWMGRPKSTLSVMSGGSDIDSPGFRRKSVASVGAPEEGPLAENDGRGSDSTEGDREHPHIPQITLQKTLTAGGPTSPSSPNSPFTMAELEQAMTRATLRPRRGTVIDASLQLQPVAA